MSFMNGGKIAKYAVFTIPINNAPDLTIKDLISGNSLQDIEDTADQLRMEYEAKNQDIKDPDKPVRLVLQDIDGKSYLEKMKIGWTVITNKVKDTFDDENNEPGTPENANNHSDGNPPEA